MDLQNGILAKLCDMDLMRNIYRLHMEFINSFVCLYNNMHLTVAAKSYKLLVKHIS